MPVAPHVPDGRAEDVHDVGDVETEAFVEAYVLQLVGLEEADSVLAGRATAAWLHQHELDSAWLDGSVRSLRNRVAGS